MSSATEGNVTTEKEEKSRQNQTTTVRDFLERHKEEPVFMMTPGGYVYLVPEQIGNLLSGKPVKGSPYSWRECVQIVAEELLPQSMESMNHASGTWYVLTRRCEPEMTPDPTSEEGMVCRV